LLASLVPNRHNYLYHDTVELRLAEQNKARSKLTLRHFFPPESHRQRQAGSVLNMANLPLKGLHPENPAYRWYRKKFKRDERSEQVTLFPFAFMMVKSACTLWGIFSEHCYFFFGMPTLLDPLV
jgi:hypothetical protein